MNDVIQAATAFLHWSWLAVAAILMVFGLVVTGKLFTQERLDRFGWWWDLLHHTQATHPIIVGALIGLGWRDHDLDGNEWPIIASAVYFAAAGVASMFGWVVITWLVKKHFGEPPPRLPGLESQPPPTTEQVEAMEDLADALEPESGQ